jgi:hypothetical protein
MYEVDPWENRNSMLGTANRVLDGIEKMKTRHYGVDLLNTFPEIITLRAAAQQVIEVLLRPTGGTPNVFCHTPNASPAKLEK